MGKIAVDPYKIMSSRVFLQDLIRDIVDQIYPGSITGYEWYKDGGVKSTIDKLYRQMHGGEND